MFFLGSTTWAWSESFNCPLFSFPCVARTSWRECASLTFRLGPEQLYLAEFGLASYLSHRIATFLSLPLSACLLYRAAGRIPHLTWRWLPAGAALYIPPYWAEKMVNILHRFLFFSVNQTASADVIFHRVIFCYSTEKAYFYSLKCWIYMSLCTEMKALYLLAPNQDAAIS